METLDFAAAMAAGSPSCESTIYGLRCPSGMLRYVGSTRGPLHRRLASHRLQCSRDPLACPLYRWADEFTNGMADWTSHAITTVRLPADTSDATRRELTSRIEALTINALRRVHPDLLNSNAPVDDNASRREYQAAWRTAHPGYMAAKSRQARQRRNARLAAAREARPRRSLRLELARAA